ncbi:MAG TPA: hypothetical protein DCS37_02675 [Clostridiales bacterium]|nr:hypothetical protein [Clostridiales bacterium]
MVFGERLQQLMKETKTTQVVLARAIGYTQRAVSKWINNQAEPTASAIYKCAKFFDVSSDYLIGLSDI